MKDSNRTELTGELYKSLTDEKSLEIIKLKDKQLNSNKSINNQIKELKELKKQLKALKNKIKISKHFLRDEKRNYSVIKKELSNNKAAIINLNETFTSEDSFIDINEYQTKKR